MRLTVDRVTVRFAERVVLDDASATFDSGETTAIMGPSGSGKSTLLGVLAGLIAPTEGEVSIPRPENSRIEWLVQSTPLLARRTVLDNVRLSTVLHSDTQTATVLPALRALRDVSLLPLARSRVSRLSGGEKQRVAIARAITANTPILLADEPTASLDPSTRSQVVESLSAAAKRGSVVIIATHDPYVADRCSRILRLSEGKLKEEGKQ